MMICPQLEKIVAEKELHAPGFEGPEKLLEIWFKPFEYPVVSSGRKGLFQVKKDDWIDMLRLVKCEIISTISVDAMDAYLLR